MLNRNKKSRFSTLIGGVMVFGMVALTAPASAQVNELDQLIQQMVEKKMGELNTQMGVVINLSGR